MTEKNPCHNPNDMEYPGYDKVFRALQSRIQRAQIAASTAVNAQMIQLYWEIGHLLLQQSVKAKWGDGALMALSRDLRTAFPDSKGYSKTNLYEMKLLAKCYRKELPKPVSLIPWGHNKHLLHRVKTNDERVWYAQQTIEYGWSRSILEMYIDKKLYAREGKAITNFQQTLPAPQSDLAQQVTRDPYCFDFLTLRKDYIEKELEAGLAEHVRKTLMALGKGFAYLGSQYPIEVGGNDYFIDMLFFHVRLNCFVVVELKTGTFQPEFAGKMNFYLSAVDSLLRRPDHDPTIGLFLCKDKGHPAVVEYSLQDIRKPMGVSSYITNITDELPDDLGSGLPSREELAARLDQGFLEDDEDENAQKEQVAQLKQEANPD